MFSFNSIELELRRIGNAMEIDMDSGANYKQNNIKGYFIDEFRTLQDLLIRALNNFQSTPTLANLRVLADKGFEARNYLKSGFVQSNCLKYFNDFEKLYKHKQTEEIVLRITHPGNFSFPFGLIFITDPQKFDWNNSDIKEIIDHFLGMRLYIQNRYESHKHKGLPNKIERLNSHRVTNVMHGIDDHLNTIVEESVWETYDVGNLDPTRIYNTTDLVNGWLAQPTPHLVHFSSHVYTDPGRKKIVLTLSGGQVFETINLKTAAGYQKLEYPPLVFLNSCESSVYRSESGEAINFVEGLYPDYALGFIATTFGVKNQVAGRMAQKFYEYFFEQHMPILFALERAKQYLIFVDDEYSVLGYNLWEADIFLTYKVKFNGKARIQRKINLKKTKP